jgi:Domain of unknown function (DUF1877)
MGMTCTLYRVTGPEIEHLIEQPSTLHSFLDFDNGAPAVRTVKEKGLLGFFFRLFGIRVSEVSTEASSEHTAPRPSEPQRVIDIEKGWHGLHFLFTGTADGGEEPACYLVRGGEDLDDDGYARALRPEKVRRLSQYLDSLSPADLERRYDPVRMTKLDIYPAVIWQHEARDSLVEWLLDCFSEVKTFINRAAAAGDGVIVHIS